MYWNAHERIAVPLPLGVKLFSRSNGWDVPCLPQMLKKTALLNLNDATGCSHPPESKPSGLKARLRVLESLVQ
jgi:hypothetical protein